MEIYLASLRLFNMLVATCFFQSLSILGAWCHGIECINLNRRKPSNVLNIQTGWEEDKIKLEMGNIPVLLPLLCTL